MLSSAQLSYHAMRRCDRQPCHLSAAALVTLWCWDKIPSKGNRKKVGFVSQFEGVVQQVGKARQQKQDVTDRIVSLIRSREW